MKSPCCPGKKLKVTKTIPLKKGTKRYMTCLGCRQNYSSKERLEIKKFPTNRTVLRNPSNQA